MRLHLVVDVIPDQVYPDHNNQTFALEDLADSLVHDEDIRITTATNVYSVALVSVEERKQA